MLLPVLSVSRVARVAHLSDERVLAIARANRIPIISYEGDKQMLDADAIERLAGRELGAKVADAIHKLRGGSGRARVQAGKGNASPLGEDEAEEECVYDPDNIEQVLRAALESHGGILSYPLFTAWCVREGLPVPDPTTLARHMGVASWTEALKACGGRRGVTTPKRRTLALRTLRTALDAHAGRLRMTDYAAWARATDAEWRDPQRLHKAAGFELWSKAVEAAQALPPEARSRGGRNAS